MSTDVQQRIASELERETPARLRHRDPEYRALRKLAERNRKHPPRTPLDALQHVVDVAREMTHATFGALAVTGGDDYVEGFVVSGMDEQALAALKGPPQGHGPLGTMRQDGLPVHLTTLAAREGVRLPAQAPGDECAARRADLRRRGGARRALRDRPQAAASTSRDADEQALRVLARHAGLIIEASWY